MEEKQFIQISPETVDLIAETVGITNLDPNTAIGLAEDASYRCREVVNICGQLLRHAKRRKLTTKDVNEALELYDADPILGHDVVEPSTYTMLKNNTEHLENQNILYVPDEKLIDLRSYALAPSPPIVGTSPCIQASWLSLEGHYYPENEEAKAIDFPQQANVTPALMQYYSTIISVTLGDSETMMNTLTKDLEVNTKIGTLLPFIVSFIRTGMQKHCENKVLMRRLLSLLQSLFTNPSLNLSPKPYLSHLVTALLSSLIVDRAGQQKNQSPGMWNGHNDIILNIDHVQQASRILYQVLHRWATPVNQLRSQTHRALREYLKDTKISYSSHYGALSAMIALGPEVLEDCLIPQMEEYVKATKEKMKTTEDEQLASVASFNKRDAGFYDNQKRKIILNVMWGTLITAGRLILSYYSRNMRKILRRTDFVDSIHHDVKIKRENGSENDSFHDKIHDKDFQIIDTNGKICISQVYAFLYEQFGSSLSILYSDPSRFKNKRSKNNHGKDLRGKQNQSALKRFGNLHHKSLNRNPFECVGRMRIRILGKHKTPIINEFDNSSLSFNVKREADEQPYSQLDLKSFSDDKNNFQQRPTSSTSSDADFNYLAGCGLPSDIFEPVTSENNPSLNNPQIFHRVDIKSEEADTCVSISASVIKSFEMARSDSLNTLTVKSDLSSIKSPTTVTSIRCRRINIAFGTSQWPRDKLKRKRFTPSLIMRHHIGINEGFIVKGHIAPTRVVVGKRMGTPRGVTTKYETVMYSCSLMSIV